MASAARSRAGTIRLSPRPCQRAVTRTARDVTRGTVGASFTAMPVASLRSGLHGAGTPSHGDFDTDGSPPGSIGPFPHKSCCTSTWSHFVAGRHNHNPCSLYSHKSTLSEKGCDKEIHRAGGTSPDSRSSPSPDRLHDLHGVQRGALPQVVPTDEQGQPMFGAGITPDATDVGRIAASGLQRRGDVAQLYRGRPGEDLPRPL